MKCFSKPDNILIFGMNCMFVVLALGMMGLLTYLFEYTMVEVFDLTPFKAWCGLLATASLVTTAGIFMKDSK